MSLSSRWPRDFGDTKSHITKARSWLLDHALPLWLEYGVDRTRGGFYDALDPITLCNASDIKRLRVAARQTYVFSYAAKQGLAGGSQVVAHGLESLFGQFRSVDGGFISCCDLNGAAVDPTRDLYDLAFTLFALAHAYSVLPDQEIRDEALALLNFINNMMQHPEGGFVEAIPARTPRRQNPHMHLLEAALACAESFGDQPFFLLCKNLGDLLENRFLSSDRRVLYEFFDEGLRLPVKEANGYAVMEPGHHFEWIWLISEYKRICDHNLSGARGLASFSLRHGVSKHANQLFGSVYEDGRVAQADVRLWPHTEWLRAAALAPDVCGSSAEVWAVIERFLDAPVLGTWHETWDSAKQSFQDGAVPASTLYHLTSGISFLLSSEGDA